MIRNLRFRKRNSVSMARRILTPVIFVLLAFVFCGFLLAAVGSNPIAVYARMMKTVCSYSGLTRSIEAGIPLMLTGLAVSFGYRMNLNNIGADGQYALGSLFACSIALG